MNKPTYSEDVYETVQFADDVKVEILTRAVRELKVATKREMNRQLNITENFTWAHAITVAPEFFWTTIDPYRFKPNPEPDDPVITYDGGPWHRNLNSFGLRGSAFWLFHMQCKFHVALHRNQFRLEEWPGEPRQFYKWLFHSVFGMTPTSRNALSHTRKHHCSSPEEANGLDSSACGPGTLSPASIVITFNNASLSFLPARLNMIPRFWSTFLELGSHGLDSCRDPARCATHHWNTTIEKFDTSVQHINSTDRPAVDLVLAGDSWTESSLAIFSERLEASGIDMKIDIKTKIHRPDTFAATQRAARWSMHYLNDYDPFPGVPVDPKLMMECISRMMSFESVEAHIELSGERRRLPNTDSSWKSRFSLAFWGAAVALVMENSLTSLGEPRARFTAWQKSAALLAQVEADFVS